MVLQNTSSLEETDNTSFPIGFGASLLATGVAVSLLCQPSFTHVFTWRTAAAVTVMYVATAALVHAGAVFGVRAVFREYMKLRLSRLVWAIWMRVCVAPLAGSSHRQELALGAGRVPILSVAATALLTQQRVRVGDDLPWQSQGLFALLRELALWRMLAPSPLTAAALQAGVAGWARISVQDFALLR